jgi:hypothetical protein
MLHRHSRPWVAGCRWLPASRWWNRELELDIVAAAVGDPNRVLVGEAKLACSAAEARHALAQLAHKASRCPALVGKSVEPAIWVARWSGGARPAEVVTAAEVVEASG